MVKMVYYMGLVLTIHRQPLTLQWWRILSYKNQSIDFQSESVDWFLYDRDHFMSSWSEFPFLLSSA